MNKKALYILIPLIVAMTLLFSILPGSSSAPLPSPSASPAATAALPTPEPTPTPTPTPQPLPAEDELLAQMMETGPADYFELPVFEITDELHSYVDITTQQDTAYSLSSQYETWLRAAADSLNAERVTDIDVTVYAPSWQMLSILSFYYGSDPERFSEVIQSVCDITVTPVRGVGDDYSITVEATPRNPVELFYSLPKTEELTPFSLLLSYAYLTTIFDDDMNIREEIPAPTLEPLLFPIEHPSEYYFEDGWNAARDGGARRHTGTDINAPEGTNLLASVDGVIFDAGNSSGSGNYIVVEGSDGTQYHYYHMVEPSDLVPGTEVKQGDVVGHVGNTGNSTANHLHFTIVTADGQYVNPYHYLKDSQQQTIEAQLESAEPVTEPASIILLSSAI